MNELSLGMLQHYPPLYCYISKKNKTAVVRPSLVFVSIFIFRLVSCNTGTTNNHKQHTILPECCLSLGLSCAVQNENS